VLRFLWEILWTCFVKEPYRAVRRLSMYHSSVRYLDYPLYVSAVERHLAAFMRK
jgi:hypothetical protein